MDRAKTVTDVKAAFLRTQVRLLSAILQPSRQWRDFADNAEEDNLSDKVIHEVMSKGKLCFFVFLDSHTIYVPRWPLSNGPVPVNAKLKEHNRSVYSAPSQRHVAEQIDALYWNIVSEEDVQADQDTVVVTRDADLTETEYLPMPLPLPTPTPTIASVARCAHLTTLTEPSNPSPRAPATSTSTQTPRQISPKPTLPATELSASASLP
jgi:hypothetical protein